MILVYHKVKPFATDVLTVPLPAFIWHMFLLRKKKVVYFDDYDPEDQEQVVISFDDGFKEVLRYALPVLRFFNYPFEMFIVGDYLRKAQRGYHEFLDEQELALLVRHGARLQYHTKSHHRLNEIRDSDILEKEIRCPDDIKKLDKSGFSYFAYPFWVYNDETIEVVRKYYKGARTRTDLSRNTPYTMAGVRMSALRIDLLRNRHFTISRLTM